MKRRDSGFTLLEILLAVGILATISAYTINALSTQIEHRNRLEIRNNAFHAMHVAMSRLYDDFRHIYVTQGLGSTTIVKQALVWRPSGKLMYFTSQNYNSFQANTPQSNLAQIRYSIKEDPKDSAKKQLWRIVDTELVNSIEYDDTGVAQLLIDDLADFSVQFWDGADWSTLGEWDTTSSSYSNKLPKMAKIHLESYQPITDIEKQRRAVAGPGDGADDRIKIVLETVVFLLKSEGQTQLKEPSQEYPWK